MGQDNAIRFACESCAKTYKVPAAHAGRKTRCKACGAALRVPELPQPVSDTQDDDFIGLLDEDPPQPKAPAREPTRRGRSPDRPRKTSKRPASKPAPKNPTKPDPARHKPNGGGHPFRPSRRGAGTVNEPALAEPDYHEPAYGLAAPDRGAVALQPSAFPARAAAPRKRRLPSLGLGRVVSACIAASVPLVIIGFVLIGVFVSATVMLQLFGWVLTIVGMILVMVTAVQYMIIGFRELGFVGMWVSGLPVIGVFVLLRYWDVLGPPFLRQIGASLIMFTGLLCLIFSMPAGDGGSRSPANAFPGGAAQQQPWGFSIRSGRASLGRRFISTSRAAAAPAGAAADRGGPRGRGPGPASGHPGLAGVRAAHR